MDEPDGTFFNLRINCNYKPKKKVIEKAKSKYFLYR